MKREGMLLIISGPSGSGKGTVVKELVQKENFALSVSATTRTPRTGEIEGVHYYFYDKETFEKIDLNNMKMEDLINFIKNNPSILKRPIIMDEHHFLVGYNEEEIRIFIPRSQRRKNSEF